MQSSSTLKCCKKIAAPVVQSTTQDNSALSSVPDDGELPIMDCILIVLSEYSLKQLHSITNACLDKIKRNTLRKTNQAAVWNAFCLLCSSQVIDFTWESFSTQSFQVLFCHCLQKWQLIFKKTAVQQLRLVTEGGVSNVNSEAPDLTFTVICSRFLPPWGTFPLTTIAHWMCQE